MRAKKAELPQCLAWVPRRCARAGGSEPAVEAHRCKFKSHALEEKGVELCRVHAKVRQKPWRRGFFTDPNQIPMFQHEPFAREEL